jgi:flap endonuclease GEN
MGVKSLWPALAAIGRPRTLEHLKGKVLAVDLSIWVCESQTAFGLKQSVSKPHLRNLFYRILCCMRFGIRLVFVTDGPKPSAKRGKRNKNNLFKCMIRECQQLIIHFGIPVVQSTGEAEACCAWLNGKGIVDGVITSDNDALLYGAHIVYKDFNITEKVPLIVCATPRPIVPSIGCNS